MHFPVEATRKTLIFFTITSCIIRFAKAAGDKTLNLKIGFDLTQGKNGAPALRIGDFDDLDENDRHYRALKEEVTLESGENKENGRNVRAFKEEVTLETEEHKEDSPAIRADSFSDEKHGGRSEELSQEARSSDNSNESDDSYGNKRQYSTRGLSPAEYEPEDHPNIHERGHENEDSGSGGDGARHRYKRHLGGIFAKRKSKKAHSGSYNKQ